MATPIAEANKWPNVPAPDDESISGNVDKRNRNTLRKPVQVPLFSTINST
jgi:hypothetical protein